VTEYLSRVEREIYELILRSGELMAKDVPFKKAVVPSLVRKGLVEVYKKPVSALSGKKCKFLCIRREPEDRQNDP
jgi:hypothetical protein